MKTVTPTPDPPRDPQIRPDGSREHQACRPPGRGQHRRRVHRAGQRRQADQVESGADPQRHVRNPEATLARIVADRLLQLQAGAGRRGLELEADVVGHFPVRELELRRCPDRQSAPHAAGTSWPATAPAHGPAPRRVTARARQPQRLAGVERRHIQPEGAHGRGGRGRHAGDRSWRRGCLARRRLSSRAWVCARSSPACSSSSSAVTERSRPPPAPADPSHRNGERRRHREPESAHRIRPQKIAASGRGWTYRPSSARLPARGGRCSRTMSMGSNRERSTQRGRRAGHAAGAEQRTDSLQIAGSSHDGDLEAVVLAAARARARAPRGHRRSSIDQRRATLTADLRDAAAPAERRGCRETRRSDDCHVRRSSVACPSARRARPRPYRASGTRTPAGAARR